MFLAVSKYLKPVEEIDKYLSQHISFLDKCYEKKVFIFSGRRVPRIGGVILLNVNTENEARDILKEDPFEINKIAEYDIIEFVPSKSDPDFSKFIKNI